MGAAIISFLAANWYWILLAVVVLIGLSILNKAINILGFLWKIISFPFKFLWRLIKLPIIAIKNAKSNKKQAEKANKE